MRPLIAICLALVLSSYCSAITGNELVENAQRYDSKTITFEGEAIGDIMVRGNYAWLNVNDGSRAIGVWAKKEQVQDIKFAGNYQYTGDKIKVVGVFHRACKEHGGDLDLHAHKIEIREPGYKQQHKIYPAKVVIVIVLLMAILLVIFLPRIFKSSS